MQQNRYRIDYRQNGKEYKYFIAAKNAEVGGFTARSDKAALKRQQGEQLDIFGVAS